MFEGDDPIEGFVVLTKEQQNLLKKLDSRYAESLVIEDQEAVIANDGTTAFCNTVSEERLATLREAYSEKSYFPEGSIVYCFGSEISCVTPPEDILEIVMLFLEHDLKQAITSDSLKKFFMNWKNGFENREQSSKAHGLLECVIKNRCNATDLFLLEFCRASICSIMPLMEEYTKQEMGMNLQVKAMANIAENMDSDVMSYFAYYCTLLQKEEIYDVQVHYNNEQQPPSILGGINKCLDYFAGPATDELLVEVYQPIVPRQTDDSLKEMLLNYNLLKKEVNLYGLLPLNQQAKLHQLYFNETWIEDADDNLFIVVRKTILRDVEDGYAFSLENVQSLLYSLLASKYTEQELRYAAVVLRDLRSYKELVALGLSPFKRDDKEEKISLLIKLIGSLCDEIAIKVDELNKLKPQGT